MVVYLRGCNCFSPLTPPRIYSFSVVVQYLTHTILTIIIFPVLDKRLKLRVGTRVYLVSSWNKPGTEADIGSLSVNTCHYQTMSHSQFIFLPSPSFFLHQIPGCPCTDLHVRARAVCRSCGFLPPTPAPLPCGVMSVGNATSSCPVQSWMSGVDKELTGVWLLANREHRRNIMHHLASTNTQSDS